MKDYCDVRIPCTKSQRISSISCITDIDEMRFNFFAEKSMSIPLLFYNARIVENHWITVKFFIDNIFLLGLVVLSGGALLFPFLQQRGNKLGVAQAIQLINQNKTIIVDVREETQFAAGHIREAKNIPVGELSERIAELDKFKSRNILIVCQSGTRSAGAANTLNKAGFTTVFGLTGGMTAWHAQSMPVVTEKAAVIKGTA